MNTNSASNQVLTQPESEYQLPEWDARLTAMIVFSCFSPFWYNVYTTVKFQFFGIKGQFRFAQKTITQCTPRIITYAVYICFSVQKF